MFREKISRRSFLQNAGKAALGGGLLYAVGGLVEKPKPGWAASKKAKKGAKGVKGDVWKQYAGTKLVFMSENTPPTSAAKAHLQEFYDLTGIEVDIRQDVLSTVQEKCGIDLKGGSSAYHLNYAQDKPMGTMFADYWADMKPFIEDPDLPKDPEGYGDDKWGYRWLDVCGRFYGEDKIVALPYDNAVAIMFYRLDLFEKHSKAFEKQFGYPLVYTDNTTWKNVIDFMQFFNNKKNQTDVEYGFGFQGLEGWAGQLDFQRPIFAHGQWQEWEMKDQFLGTREPGPCKWGDDQSIMTLTKMKELYKLAHPESLSWDWSGVNNAFQTGKVAMCVNYGEFAASAEDPAQSVAAGKIGYGLDPKGEKSWIVNGGPAVNATNYGIGGIAINGNLKEDLQKAAWTFVAWITTPAVQKMVMKELGGTPTRMSVLTDPEVVAAAKRPTTMPNAMTYPPILKAIKAPHVVPGPKIPKWNEYATITCVEIARCMAGKQGPEETAKSLKKKLDQIHGV